MDGQRLDDFGDHSSVVESGRRILISITNAEAATEIEIFQVDAKFTKFANKTSQTSERFFKRPQRCDLRADVGADTVPLNPFRTGVLGVEFAGGVPVQSEFVIAVAGGNMRMAASLDVGIDADGDARGMATAFRLL